MSKLDELKHTFFDECDEALQSIESGLTSIREGEQTEETINAIFRAVHSVKGGAGIFGFDELVKFAHAFETVLDLLRHDKIPQSDETLHTMLTANDVLSDLVQLSRDGSPISADFGVECRRALDVIAGVDAETSGEDVAADFDDIDFTPVSVEGTDFGLAGHAFVLRPERLVSLDEFATAFGAFSQLGSCSIHPNVSAIPELSKLSAGDLALTWDGTIETSLSLAEIQEQLGASAKTLGLSFDAIAGAPAETQSTFVDMPLETMAAAPSIVPQHGVGAAQQAVSPPASEGKAQRRGTTTTRIELEKIDRAVNLVGELVISQAMLGQIVSELPEQTSAQLLQTIQEVSQRTRELKDSVMSMRAQPVGSVFQRMPRLVRELSVKTGKKVRLILEGENTEVDRSVIEQLSDPLTHIIRNSVDHGIETPEVRLANGKNEEGTIRLSADQRGGRIVIQVKDDGAGIDSERVLKKAKEKGLVPPQAVLSEDEVNSLIMMPGFSTAEVISDISGRGVGMDVVRASIAEIGGRVTLKSVRGRGLTIQLSLPLTLAVMDGMVIKAGGETYVVPLSAISECLLPDQAVMSNLIGTQGMLHLRGEHIPVLRLRNLFSLNESELRDDKDGVVIVVDAGDNNRIGILVDELCGHQQVVIKSIEESYKNVVGIAAATILGNGRVALILDVEKLGDLATVPAAQTQTKALTQAII